MPECGICNEEVTGLGYGLTPVEIKKDTYVFGDGIHTFVHDKCMNVVTKIYSQDIVDGFIDLDDPFGLKESSDA